MKTKIEYLEQRLSLSAWPIRSISYSFINIKSVQKIAIEQAIKIWDQALPGLSFHEIRDRGGVGGKAWGDHRFGDIRISSIPLLSSEIAFAYGPPTSIRNSPTTGDIIFNTNVINNYNLYDVALHEIGHTIGLVHSLNSGDVMYPFYQAQSTLSPGDILAAKTLYS